MRPNGLREDMSMHEIPNFTRAVPRDRVIPAGGGPPVALRLLTREAWIEGAHAHGVARWALGDQAVRTTVMVSARRDEGHAEMDIYDPMTLAWRRLDALRSPTPDPARCRAPVGDDPGDPAPPASSVDGNERNEREEAPPAEALWSLCADVEGDLLSLGAAILQAASVIDVDDE